MVLAANKAESAEDARAKLKEVIKNGKALDKLAEFVKAQGGDPAYVYDPDLLPKAAYIENICSDKEGYIEKIACDEIGICSLILGGGRETKESEIDLSVGLVLQKKKGDYVKKGDILAIMHGNDKNKMEIATNRFLAAYTIGENKPTPTPFIKDILQ